MQDEGASRFVLHSVVVLGKLGLGFRQIHDGTRVFVPPDATDREGWGDSVMVSHHYPIPNGAHPQILGESFGAVVPVWGPRPSEE